MLTRIELCCQEEDELDLGYLGEAAARLAARLGFHAPPLEERVIRRDTIPRDETEENILRRVPHLDHINTIRVYDAVGPRFFDVAIRGLNRAHEAEWLCCEAEQRCLLCVLTSWLRAVEACMFEHLSIDDFFRIKPETRRRSIEAAAYHDELLREQGRQAGKKDTSRLSLDARELLRRLLNVLGKHEVAGRIPWTGLERGFLATLVNEGWSEDRADSTLGALSIAGAIRTETETFLDRSLRNVIVFRDAAVDCQDGNESLVHDPGVYSEKDIPLLAPGSHDWVSAKEAAKIDNTTIGTLKDYRIREYRFRADDMSCGIDRYGRIWRRPPTTDSAHPKYYKPSLRKHQEK